jgi:alpha-1,2-mannosyltransferase
MANVAGPRRLLARPERIWWLLPIAATAFVVTRLWTQTELQRLDFHIYYEAVSGWQPGAFYDYENAASGLGFTYPPISGLVLRPITTLPFDTAELLWLVVNALASLAFLLGVARHLPRRPSWAPTVPILVAICMLTTPVWLSLRLGQINALLALAVLADVMVVRRRWAGALIGLCGAIKLTPMYAALYFGAARRWRALAISVGTFATATLVAWAWMPSDSRRYWTIELLATDRVGPLGSPFNNSPRRLIDMLGLPGGFQTVLWLVLAVALTYVAVRRAREALERDNRLAAITLVMCAGLAVAPITWSHHLYFLLPAVFLLVGSGRSMPRNIAAAVLAFLLCETQDPGQDPTAAAWRAVALIAVVLFLPLDDARTEREDDVALDDATGATAT